MQPHSGTIALIFNLLNIRVNIREFTEYAPTVHAFFYPVDEDRRHLPAG